MYLEGSDQHRGWFQSSLLEVLRHARPRALRRRADPRLRPRREGRGEDVEVARATSLSPQDLMKTSGADILRLWVASSDYSSDIRFGPAILQGTRRVLPQAPQHAALDARHAGALRRRASGCAVKDMPELERLMLHRLAELERDHPRGLRDVRLQARGRGAVAVHEHRPLRLLLRHPQGRALLRALLVAQAPGRAGDHRADLPLHLRVAGAAAVLHGRGGLARALSLGGGLRAPASCFPRCRSRGATTALAEKWEKIKRVRRVVTGALEIERAAKKIGSSLEAAPQVFIADRRSDGGARWRRPGGGVASRRPSR